MGDRVAKLFQDLALAIDSGIQIFQARRQAEAKRLTEEAAQDLDEIEKAVFRMKERRGA